VKIKGPGGPEQPPELGDVEKTKKADKPEGPGFAEKLGSSTSTSTSTSTTPISAIAADLKAGKITPEQAVQRVVDLAVANGAPGVPERVKESIRAELERLVADDPFLRGKAAGIGVVPKEDE
jgi:hypothetical protein